jgi:hypothetical protein
MPDMQAAESKPAPRRCEERSDEAIQSSVLGAPGLLRFARNDRERAKFRARPSVVATLTIRQQSQPVMVNPLLSVVVYFV